METCQIHNLTAKRHRNPLREDPTRTGSLRNRFMREIRTRVRSLVGDVREYMVTNDVLGLNPRRSMFALNESPRQHEFRTDGEKVRIFIGWFEDRAEVRLFASADGKPWTLKHVGAAYDRGKTRAFLSTKRKEPAGSFESVMTSFLARNARKKAARRKRRIRSPAADRAEILAQRSFTDLKGVSAEMSKKIARILSEGVLEGQGASTIAAEMARQIRKLSETRAMTIARTEIIAAHAEGQLDQFQEIGVDSLNVDVEWSTAGDDRVCPQCEEMEGKIFTVDEARGLIPLHPNCRCAWIPAV